MKAPPAEAAERFRRDLLALTGAPPSSDRPLGVAVSGGADSMALLLLAIHVFPGEVRAGAVDHGLRPEAADEAALVARYCVARGVPHAVLYGPENETYVGSVQERARLLRYAALRRWADAHGIVWIALAHQRDDVAESFLMRARRGAGVGGLAQMPLTRPLGPGDEAPMLVRPLLGWSRAELRGIVTCTDTPFVDDPSNLDARFDRVRIRQLLAGTAELPAGRLALAAGNLRHAEDALDWMVKRELPHRLAANSRFAADDPFAVTVDTADLPYELRRRFVRIAIDHVRLENGRSDMWHEQGLDRLVRALEAGEAGTLADVLARPQGTRWRFTIAPPRRSH